MCTTRAMRQLDVVFCRLRSAVGSGFCGEELREEQNCAASAASVCGSGSCWNTTTKTVLKRMCFGCLLGCRDCRRVSADSAESPDSADRQVIRCACRGGDSQSIKKDRYALKSGVYQTEEGQQAASVKHLLARAPYRT